MRCVERLLEVFYPGGCHICGEKMPSGDRMVCTRCLMDLPRTRFHAVHPNPMEERLNLPFIGRATGHFFYNSSNKFSMLVQDFKYRGFFSLARHLGRLVAEELLPTGFFYGIDGMVPVPMHWRKKMMRGYNQAEKIACGIREQTGLPIDFAVRAIHPHDTQTAKSAHQRRSNVEGIFKLKNPSFFIDKHILLVDDIFTTGSTLTEMVLAIRKSVPDARLSLFTLGYTGGN